MRMLIRVTTNMMNKTPILLLAPQHNSICNAYSTRSENKEKPLQI